MKGGVDLQKYVDLLVPGPSKMKIIHGEGPIHLIGSHCVDYMGLQEEESEDEVEISKFSMKPFLKKSVFSPLQILPYIRKWKFPLKVFIYINICTVCLFVCC